MKKLRKKVILYCVILMILVVSLTGCSASDDSSKLKEKLKSEISFLDTQLSDMLNSANGISFENYKLTAQKVDTKLAKESTSSKSENSGSGSESGSGSSDDSSSQENSESSSSEKNYMNYNMEAYNLLTSERTINWEVLKTNIETLYDSWATIVLDLYKINVASEDILGFTNELNTAMQVIKKEDKNATLDSLAKLYSYLAKYSSSYGENATIVNVLKTKSSVYNAYAIIERNKLEEVKKELANAEQSFIPIINDIESNKNVQFNVNKVYILLKELENSADNEEPSIFYIKYKNVMEELNILL